MAGGPGGSGTTASTSKQVPGPTGHTTILMLEPYSYHISLIYLGEKRVQHGAGYRCRFGLRKNKQPNFNNADAAKVDPLTEIPNVASVPIKSATAPATAPTADELASKSRSDGGDNSEPANDLDYRVVITDNHGLRGDDIRLLGSAANTRSKPQSYRQRRFEEDIILVVREDVVER